MKKITVLAMMMLGLSTISFAQRGEHRQKLDPEEVAQKRTDKMKESLGLSEAQYQEILKLNQEQAKVQVEKREERKEKVRATREEMKKERQAYRSSLEGILTPDQLEKYKDEIKAKRERQKGKRGDRRGDH